METVLTIVHVLVALFLIGVVLLQAGKGGGMGAAFGGGGGQSAFGASSGLSFIGKVTAGAATIFMLTSMTLAYLASAPSSVVDDVELPATEQEAPAIQPSEEDAGKQEAAAPTTQEAAVEQTDDNAAAQEGAAEEEDDAAEEGNQGDNTETEEKATP